MARASHPGHIVWVKRPAARRRGRHRTGGAVRVLPGFPCALARPGVRGSCSIRSGCR